ncbi:ABC transporter ATP-binding protein [Acidaminobacter sp. JC074]|nr:ABC transporter ATP-binding protein [Acidaminobacter sp. JC074]
MLKTYMWTMGYFRPYIIHTSLLILSGGMIILGQVTIPRRMGYIIDKIADGSLSIIGHQIISLSMIVGLIILAKIISNMLEQIIATKIMRDMQKDLIGKYQSLGFSYYDKHPTGKIISLFENSVRETQKTYNFLFPHFIYSLAQFIVPSVILLMNEPLFFLVTMVGNILYVFFNHGTNKRIRKYLDLESKAAHQYHKSVYDSLAAAKEMKALGADKWLHDTVKRDFESYKNPRMKSILWRHIRFTIVGLTLTISMFLVYYVGLNLMKSGDLSLGSFIGYTFLIGVISRGFSIFFYVIPSQYHALTYAKDLRDFMKLNGQNTIGVLELIDHDIEFKNVSFGYGENLVIGDLNLMIPAGQKMAIVGETGCGKTTLIKLIGRFYKTQGLSIGGIDIEDLSERSIRDSMAYVFQETFLFNMSIKDNVRFSKPDATDDEVILACKKAHAHDFIVNTGSGYETVLGQNGLGLSGGQKQRIALARMILKDPEIIILDEATSSLDNETELMVKETIENISEDKTIIAVAHRLSTIKDFERIIVLDKGSIAEDGDYVSLMNQKGLFYSLVKRGEVC